MIWLVSVVYRFRYYFAWAMSEAGLICSGFCFNGWVEDRSGDPGAPEKARWDRYVNTRIRQVGNLPTPPRHDASCTMEACSVDVLVWRKLMVGLMLAVAVGSFQCEVSFLRMQVEFSTSAAELPAHWNTCTGNFLRRCASPFNFLMLASTPRSSLCLGQHRCVLLFPGAQQAGRSLQGFGWDMRMSALPIVTQAKAAFACAQMCTSGSRRAARKPPSKPCSRRR